MLWIPALQYQNLNKSVQENEGYFMLIDSHMVNNFNQRNYTY